MQPNRQEGVAAPKRGADKTLWPHELMHGELCAWRFGANAKCDCGKEDEPNG